MPPLPFPVIRGDEEHEIYKYTSEYIEQMIKIIKEKEKNDPKFCIIQNQDETGIRSTF